MTKERLLSHRQCVLHLKREIERRIKALARKKPCAPGVGGIPTAAAACVSVTAVWKESDTARIPAMAVMSASVFAGQMVNFAIPGTGASWYLCCSMLLSSILGPFAGFLSMLVMLAIQCLFLADGGLLAFGANCWNVVVGGQTPKITIACSRSRPLEN